MPKNKESRSDKPMTKKELVTYTKMLADIGTQKIDGFFTIVTLVPEKNGIRANGIGVMNRTTQQRVIQATCAAFGIDPLIAALDMMKGFSSNETKVVKKKAVKVKK